MNSKEVAKAFIEKVNSKAMENNRTEEHAACFKLGFYEAMLEIIITTIPEARDYVERLIK